MTTETIEATADAVRCEHCNDELTPSEDVLCVGCEGDFYKEVKARVAKTSRVRCDRFDIYFFAKDMMSTEALRLEVEKHRGARVRSENYEWREICNAELQRRKS